MPKLTKILFVGDAHIPNHDVKAWELMLKAAKAWKPDKVVCLGDMGNWGSITRHKKNPNLVTQLKREVEAVNDGLDQLEGLMAKDYVYLGGNHEDWLRQYLEERAPELFDFIDIPRLLNLGARGWEYIPYKRDVRLGRVYATHDVGVASRYAVFRSLETYHHSVLTGHTHRLQYIVEGDATGGSRVAASFGWLGDVNQVDYMNQAQAKKNWALGFGLGYLNGKNGAVHLVPVPIVKGTCVLEGRLYAA